MTTSTAGMFAAFHEALTVYEQALAAYEHASLRDRPAARAALHGAEAAMRAALRGES